MGRRHLLPVTLALLAGCSPAPTVRGPSAPPPFTTELNLKQLMTLVIDPSADVVWDSVKTIITAEGAKEIAPKTDEEWMAVRTGAATLIEAGNMLMLDGRAMDQQSWMASARRLSAAGAATLRAAESKNAEGVFNAGGQIYNACKICHDNYAHFDDKPGAAGYSAQTLARAGDRYPPLAHNVRLGLGKP